MYRSLFLAGLCGAVLITPARAQSCQSPGYVVLGPCCTYEAVANGAPSTAACWKDYTGSSPTNADLVTDALCGWTGKAFDFGDRDSLSQTFTVPSYVSESTWGLSYLLSFNDPYNDAWWNRLKARIIDVTAGQVIGEHTYRGSDPDVACKRLNLPFSGSLAGHTIQVRFDAGNGYGDDVMIRVRSISFAGTSQ
jgi:hypothetical protein